MKEMGIRIESHATERLLIPKQRREEAVNGEMDLIKKIVLQWYLSVPPFNQPELIIYKGVNNPLILGGVGIGFKRGKGFLVDRIVTWQ